MYKHFIDFLLEAPPGFEPGIRVLQTRALPLGYSAEYLKFVLMNSFTYLRLATLAAYWCCNEQSSNNLSNLAIAPNISI